jgi:hypothetical protein
MRHFAANIAAAALLALLAAGCEEPNVSAGGPVEPVVQVDKIDLWAAPYALEMDNRPGPDGVLLNVNFYQVAQPKAVPVRGTLEFLLYDGGLTAGQLLGRVPVDSWSFEGDQLESQAQRTYVGYGYRFPLQWAQRPTRDIVTVVARYTQSDGRTVLSDPVSIPIGQQ